MLYLYLTRFVFGACVEYKLRLLSKGKSAVFMCAENILKVVMNSGFSLLGENSILPTTTAKKFSELSLVWYTGEKVSGWFFH